MVILFQKGRQMTRGTLEVLLVDASNLKDTDFFGKMDPYVIIQFCNQKGKSTVARGKGKAPVWNEKFTFDVEYPDNIRDEHHQYKLDLTIMDKDRFSTDDFVGEWTYHPRHTWLDHRCRR
ncbi:elicitor-responsive protein 1-like isoform X2 [Papaver somniferum]|uniref:elicitor-responsive protein 1-like isoform X2 n=1 Tax=Papaver somniferum TaxID=3469 RepID=UPI000E70301B|nr:elicitor-responsive protein 1-like isoform X2 [Papaver somniferum]